MPATGFGIIGTGQWGALHARVYSSTPGAEVVAVADVVEDRARNVASQYGAKAYTDYEDLLRDDRVRAVSIVTPDFTHEPIVIAAARAGKHVLCEKPLGMTVPGCEAAIEAADQHGVKLMVDFHNRWSPPFHKAWQSIRDGQIGRPQHAYYRLNDRIFVPTRMLKWAGRSSVLWFIGTHSIDTILWLLGDEVRRVFSVSRSRVLHGMGINTPDYYLTTLEFASGATAVIENSWIVPDAMPNIIDLKCEIVGDRGAVYLDTSHNRTLEIYAENQVSWPDFLVMPSVFGHQAGFAADSIRHFAECVIEDREPLVTGEDGLEVTRIITAIEESCVTGRPVDIAR